MFCLFASEELCLRLSVTHFYYQAVTATSVGELYKCKDCTITQKSSRGIFLNEKKNPTDKNNKSHEFPKIPKKKKIIQQLTVINEFIFLLRMSNKR